MKTHYFRFDRLETVVCTCAGMKAALADTMTGYDYTHCDAENWLDLLMMSLAARGFVVCQRDPSPNLACT